MMAVQGELPQKKNVRGGAGWWMDPSGNWRPPEEWPEDSAPFEGWVRGEDGLWSGPDPTTQDSRVRTPAADTDAVNAARMAERQEQLSRQARADKRAMFTVVGALGAAAILIVVAVFLITRAEASGNGVAQSSDTPEVIYAAETDEVVQARRRSLASEAPDVAVEQLSVLDVRDEAEANVDNLSEFDAQDWVAASVDCLDIAERVLVERSEIDVTWADQLECVPNEGRWTDRYLGTSLDSVIEADVSPLVPAAIAFESGADMWTAETRNAYLTDTAHPATLHIVASSSGHNPRAEGPDEWRPSNESTWCAYAVDWIAVKTRWELTISPPEYDALAEMLASCYESTSTGADPQTMLVDEIEPATITRSGGAS